MGSELQVGVKIALKNKRGSFLLLRRAPSADAAGKWDIAGGRINPGSSLMDNLAREVREETGLEFLGTPRLIAAQDLTTPSGRHVVRLTYVGEASEGVPVLSEEHVEYQWATLESMRALDNLDRYFKELVMAGLI